MRPYNLAYFVSHPIQYQAPMLKLLAARPEVNLKVYFISNLSLKNYADKGFGRQIAWDVPLLDGYEYEFLKTIRDKGSLSFFNPMVSGIGRALRERKWDAVWFHGYAHHSLLWAIMLAAMMKIPIFFRGESNLTCTSQGLFKDQFIKWLVKKAAALLWISTDNKTYYHHYGARDEQLFFMPYAVDNDSFQEAVEDAKTQVADLKKTLKLDPASPVFLYASKWIQRKNPLLLLEAFSTMQNKGEKAYLVYIGDGPLRPELERRVAELNLQEQVRILGFKNQTELPAYYALCDVFVLPSQKEPFGLVINEVMNAGKAIITTDEVGAAKDLVHNGLNGYVVPAGNVSALSEALCNFISTKNKTARMGVESLKIINTWNYVQDIEGILKSLKYQK